MARFLFYTETKSNGTCFSKEYRRRRIFENKTQAIMVITMYKCKKKSSRAFFSPFSINIIYMYVFFQEETSLEEYLQKKPETKAQPYMYILLLGGTRSNPRQVFTILENQALKMPSVTQAVDFAFKLSCILDLQYQPQCFAAVAVL